MASWDLDEPSKESSNVEVGCSVRKFVWRTTVTFLRNRRLCDESEHLQAQMLDRTLHGRNYNVDED